MMRKYVGVLMLLILGGCETFHGYPNPPSHIVYPGGGLMPATSLDAAESTALDNYHSSDALKRLTLSPRQYRDAFIYSELKAINDSYDIFAMNMHANRATFNIVTSGTLLALNGLAATTGGAATKAALSAASAGIIGQKGAVDKELFNAETLAALITRMDAGRLTALVPIKSGIAQDVDRYPLEGAILDIHAYRKAGNLFTTVDAISTDAGQKAGAAQAAIDKIVRGADYKTSLATKQALQGRIDKLTDRQVVGLVWLMNGNLAERSPDLQTEMNDANPSGSRFQTAKASRDYLAHWLDQDSGSPAEMSEWNVAVTLAEKN